MRTLQLWTKSPIRLDRICARSLTQEEWWRADRDHKAVQSRPERMILQARRASKKRSGMDSATMLLTQILILRISMSVPGSLFGTFSASALGGPPADEQLQCRTPAHQIFTAFQP